VAVADLLQTTKAHLQCRRRVVHVVAKATSSNTHAVRAEEMALSVDHVKSMFVFLPESTMANVFA
jgi:hypothetical protein